MRYNLILPKFVHWKNTIIKVYTNRYTDVKSIVYTLIGWFVGFYGISTFVGYLTPKSNFM